MIAEPSRSSHQERDPPCGRSLAPGPALRTGARGRQLRLPPRWARRVAALDRSEHQATSRAPTSASSETWRRQRSGRTSRLRIRSSASIGSTLLLPRAAPAPGLGSPAFAARGHRERDVGRLRPRAYTVGLAAAQSRRSRLARCAPCIRVFCRASPAGRSGRRQARSDPRTTGDHRRGRVPTRIALVEHTTPPPANAHRSKKRALTRGTARVAGRRRSARSRSRRASDTRSGS